MKTQNLFALILVMVVAFSSCKKQKQPQSPYMPSHVSVDVDGVNSDLDSYNPFRLTAVQPSGLNYQTSFPINSGADQYSLQIRLYNDSVIAGQTYCVANQGNETQIGVINQSNSLGIAMMDKYGRLYVSSYNTQFTVDSVVSAEAYGHFEGLMICGMVTPADTIVLTNGLFYAIPILN